MAHEIILTKEGGKVRFSKDLEMVLSTLKNGKYILAIKGYREQRTINQNSLFWLWMQCLSRETGSEPMEFYRYFESKYLSRPSSIDGELIVIDRIKYLDTRQMTELMEKVKAEVATEYGITLPLPEDLYFEQFVNAYKDGIF